MTIIYIACAGVELPRYRAEALSVLEPSLRTDLLNPYVRSILGNKRFEPSRLKWVERRL